MPTHRWTRRDAALGLLASASLPLGTAHASDRRDAIATAVEAAFRPLMAAHAIPGMAVGVTAGGERHFFEYGVASREAGTPVTRDTLFEIGSISKTFTATLGMLALARGRLSLADTPGRHWPALRGSAIDKATLLHLATYTAGGLPLQFPDEVTPATALDYFRQWRPDAAPGVQRCYSNPSIGLFGHLAAMAMGRDFTALMQEELLPQIGLASTFIRVPESAMDRYAWGYGRAQRPIRVNPGVFDAEAYGVKTTAVDLLKFVEANIAPTSLPDAMRRSVEGTHTAYFDVSGMVQGLGWEQYGYPVTLQQLEAGNSSAMALEPRAARVLTPARAPSVPTLFNKTGSTGGFGAYAAFVPARRVGILMLANRSIPNAARVTAAHAVLAAVAS